MNHVLVEGLFKVRDRKLLSVDPVKLREQVSDVWARLAVAIADGQALYHKLE